MTLTLTLTLTLTKTITKNYRAGTCGCWPEVGVTKTITKKDMTVKGFFNGLWQVFRYVILTPAGGSKRREAQQKYEEELDEAMRRVQQERKP